MTSPTQVMSSQLAALSFEQLPADVVERAKLVFLDTVGAALAGVHTPEGEIAVKLVGKLKGREEATVIGTRLKADCTYAALANGMIAHVLELDDGNRFAMGHPGVSVIPTVLALGERNGITGKQALLAAVAGYETFGRVGAAANPSHLKRGFHTTGTCGSFAAAAAAGKIVGLDETEMAEVMGVAGSLSSGIFAFMANGAMTKVLHPGNAALNGILSALLVKEGFLGPRTVFEDERGFLKAYTDEFDLDRLLQGLGQDYEIRNTYVKFHASCRHTHAAIDAALNLIRERNVDVQAIDSVTVNTYGIAAKLTGGKEITTPLSGKMSLPYSVAAAICEKEAGLRQFLPECLHKPEILSLMDRVKIEIDSRLDGMVPNHRGARVALRLRNGEVIEEEVLDCRGEPENPGTLEDQLRKFRECARLGMTDERIDALIEMFLNLEKIGDLSELAVLLQSA